MNLSAYFYSTRVCVSADFSNGVNSLSSSFRSTPTVVSSTDVGEKYWGTEKGDSGSAKNDDVIFRISSLLCVKMGDY